MRYFVAICLSLFVSTQSSAEHNQLTPEQIRDGWISLFDGKTLFGWTPQGKIDWHVENGEIRATKGDVGLLVTNSEFSDYNLHVEFRAEPTTNSGIFTRTSPKPAKVDQDCYEVNIAPLDNPFPTGSVVGRHRTDDETIKPLELWDGGWHAYDIVMRGGFVRIYLDGAAVAEFTDPSPKLRGQIGLQHNQGKIAFRNVRLLPQSTKSIFNGKDLTGWNTDRKETSEFKVTPEGELQVLNGRGQIESDGSYGDFLLQLECFVNGDALNSGVFFRCIPRDFMMGYECQIQNGMKEGDPTQPVDCGTGGFFRRQNARRIVARDREWFTMTLVADGPHMAAWVNGHQVSDWTDTRKPNENPRRGLRTEPGTLAIQGHDPTTDLRFRNLRIVELPEE